MLFLDRSDSKIEYSKKLKVYKNVAAILRIYPRFIIDGEKLSLRF